MKHIEALDQLIEAIECGRPDWDAAFIDDSKDEVSLCVLAAYRGSLDAAKALHERCCLGGSRGCRKISIMDFG